MSREVRRVPVDFDWPLNKVWKGYTSPEKFHETPCPDCFEQGQTPGMQWINRMALMLDQLVEDIDAQAAGKLMHPWLAKDQYPPCDNRKVVTRSGMWVEYEVVRPSADIVDYAEALVAGDTRGETIRRGIMSQNRYVIARNLIRAAGLPEDWGTCTTCNGHGSNEAYEGQRDEAETWEPTEPPTGDGWQLWETVSEGSPVSPVFAERAGLVDWLTTDYRQVGSHQPLTPEQAERFVEAGYSVGSFVQRGGEFMSGEAAL